MEKIRPKGIEGFQKGHPQFNTGRTHFKKGHPAPTSAFKKGSQHPRWKNGESIEHGYIYLLKPDHLGANKKGRVKRANLVMEKMIGRFLKLGEIVHHKGIRFLINSIENRQDDRPKNLQLFDSNSKHAKFHTLIRAA